MEKIFIGNTKSHTFENGGTIIKIGLPLEDIQKYVKNGWINLVVSKRKVPKNDGTDFYVTVDTYEPQTPADSMRSGMNTPPVVNQNLPVEPVELDEQFSVDKVPF